MARFPFNNIGGRTDTDDLSTCLANLTGLRPNSYHTLPRSPNLNGLIFLFLFPVVLSLVGCVPFPHFVTLTPRISGKVTEAGVAVESAKKYFLKNSSGTCRELPVGVQTTDKSGHFAIEERNRLRLIYAPFVAPVSVTP